MQTAPYAMQFAPCLPPEADRHARTPVARGRLAPPEALVTMNESALVRWCLELPRVRGKASVVGVNGPQGAGKSTLCAALVTAFERVGVRAITCSVDDFYLPRTGQLSLAAAYPGDRALEHRGAPGTHDVALGVATLDVLVEGRSVRVPLYDKSAHGGRGDRAPESAWTLAEGSWDLVLFEGWMLGFRPVLDPEPALVASNRLLAPYSDWDERLDAMVLLRAQTLGAIVDWRVDAERARRARGEGALSDQEARDYIERYLPFYRTYVSPLWERPPGRAAFRVTLGADREVV